MARIKLSALISDIIGRLGGSVFQHNQGGLSLRSQPGIIQKRAFGQQLNKGSMATVLGSWRGLSAAQIALWDNYALFLNKKQQLNANKTLSGQALFIFQNQLRSIASRSVSAITPEIITDPVIQSDPDIIQIPTIENDGGTLTVYTDRGITGTSFLFLKMSRPLSASQKSSYNKLAVIPADLIGASDNWDITTEYTQIFSRVPAVGEYINISVSVSGTESNGFSPFIQQRIIVTAP